MENNVTITVMVKTAQIQLRIAPAVKAALERAATKRKQSLTGYLLWCAAQQDKEVQDALLRAL